MVNCAWYDNVESVIHDRQDPYRGIRIFDKRADRWMQDDYPFKKIRLMDERDEMTKGRFKGMIRLLKTIKADVEACNALSSFDIYSIAYAMPLQNYGNVVGKELVYALSRFINALATDRKLANSVCQLDCKESVFVYEEKKFKSLQALEKDLSSICTELRKVTHKAARVYL